MDGNQFLFLTAIDKFCLNIFDTAFHSVRSSLFSNSVLAEIKFLTDRLSVLIGGYGSYQFTFLGFQCTIGSDNIFIGIDFKHCTCKTHCRKFRLINGRKGCIAAVFVHIPSAECSYIGKYLACLFNDNPAFLNSIELLHRNNCQSVFFGNHLFVDIKINGSGVKNIPFRCFGLHKRIAVAVNQRLNSSKCKSDNLTKIRLSLFLIH